MPPELCLSARAGDRGTSNRAITFLALASSIVASAARADDCPSRPVKIIAPLPFHAHKKFRKEQPECVNLHMRDPFTPVVNRTFRPAALVFPDLLEPSSQD